MPEERAPRTDLRRSAALENQLEQIGNRFLERLLPECQAMVIRLEACQPGSAQDLADIEMFAHRIEGSGAVLGFTTLSEQARNLQEQLQALRAAGSLAASRLAIAGQIGSLQNEARALLAKRVLRA
jgi:chemotaxis protein histidine kinase CheA